MSINSMENCIFKCSRKPLVGIITQKKNWNKKNVFKNYDVCLKESFRDKKNAQSFGVHYSALSDVEIN